MSLLTYIANRAWVCANRPAHGAFLRALERVGAEQEEYLLRTLRQNAQTGYGRQLGFGSISSVEEFQDQVPISDYEDYGPYIDQIAAGESSVLTAEEVLLFEPTSGTSSATKYIPYTRGLKQDFLRAIAPWIVSLYQRRPELLRGKSYWSISPPCTTAEQLGTIPVGFDDDLEYLGRVGRWLAGHSMAVPSSVARAADMDDFRHRTVVHLLAAGDLGLVSVWNPTFLTLLLQFFADHQDEILGDLGRAMPRRAAELNQIVDESSRETCYERIWPRLALISCWTDGPCARDAEALRQLFPAVEIQGKGLLSTEAIVSIPLAPEQDPVLAVRSHFFEFEDLATNDIVLAQDVIEGREYSVIVTTAGGLYRYRLHDVVRITGAIGQAPTMRFLGKDGQVSDRFGEKLNALHVGDCIDRLMAKHDLTPDFVLLAPGPDREGYTLLLDCSEVGSSSARSIARELDDLLRESFHYDLCRRPGRADRPRPRQESAGVR